GVARGRTWLGIRLTPIFGTEVDAATVDGDEFTLAGGGTDALAVVDVLVADGLARYAYTGAGSLAAGTVTVTFTPGAWADTEGNLAAGGTSTFRLITQGTSFFIELSGGIMLQAGDFLDKPLLHISAEVVLEIDIARTVFILTFAGQIEVYALGTLGATAGRFVLAIGDENTNPMYPIPQIWGVASLETNFEALEQYGLFLDGSAQLRFNLTNEEKTETLTLPGVGPGGSDLTETFVLLPFSFGFQIVGQAILAPPGVGELMRVQGGLYLNISLDPPEPALDLFLTGTLSFGSGSARLEYGSVTGVLMIATSNEGGAIPGVAGSIKVSSSVGIGLPDVGSLFSASGSVSIIFNTTLVEQSFTVPTAFLPLLLPGQSPTFVIPAAAPGIDGAPIPGATPAIYITAVIMAELTIGGAFTLTGMLGITAAADPLGFAYLKVDGIVGTTIPYLGALTGSLNLGVYVGTQTGVVGRVQLTLGANSIPGVSLNGQFLLEINTFSSARTIQAFAIETETVNGRPVFGGFARVGGTPTGALIVEEVTIGVVAGFRLEMYGSIVISNVLDITGHVVFSLGASGITLVVNGRAALEPFGEVTIVDSGFSITSAGLVARIDIGLDAGFGGSIGLNFNAAALLELNTTGRDATLGSTTVTPGFKL
ncbi:MAG: hypothetical protein LPK92_03525, partial [Actinomycetes bacterium]|nr:hypothetical protein [Actinomycetes bacterium]